MKQFLSIITAVTLLLTLAASGEAWQVNVKNSCKPDGKIQNVNDINEKVDIVVVGHHLFWFSDDCKMTVWPGETKSCVMPFGICPYQIRDDSQFNPKPSDIYCLVFGIPCCWDVNVEALPLPGGCKLFRK